MCISLDVSGLLFTELKNSQLFRYYIPKTNGIYLLFDSSHELVYIGKTKNLYKRVNDHLSGKTHTVDFHNHFKYVKLTEIKCELLTDIYETYLINEFRPIYNKSKVFETNMIFDKNKNISIKLSDNEIITSKYQDEIMKQIRSLGEEINNLLKNNRYYLSSFSYISRKDNKHFYYPNERFFKEELKAMGILYKEGFFHRDTKREIHREGG